MSYIREIKNLELTKDTSNSSQIISTTYTELDGSRISYTPKISSGNISLGDLSNVNVTGQSDGAVMIFDGTAGEYKITTQVENENLNIIGGTY